MGCILNELLGHLEGPDGVHPIRYLYSPKTDDFVSLLNYENYELIPPHEAENWERRLVTTYHSCISKPRKPEFVEIPHPSIRFRPDKRGARPALQDIGNS